MVQLSFIPLGKELRLAGELPNGETTSNGISFGRFAHGLHRVELCSSPRTLDLAATHRQWPADVPVAVEHVVVVVRPLAGRAAFGGVF